MPEFNVVREPGLVPFGVYDAEGNKPADISAYLRWLVLNGRSPYTVRSYALGMAHFHSWVLARGGLPEHITPSDIAKYIAAYRSEESSPGPATTNHRLTVLSGFYRFLIDIHIENPAWAGKRNPVPVAVQSERTTPMHVRQRRARADLRRRVPRPVHRQLDAFEIASLFNSARSLRDQALLKLLEWSGQRIGDWSDVNGRHGILGLALGDIDPFRRMITVQLKGSRRSHIIPVGEPFWPIYSEYLRAERPPADHSAAWISFRRGKGKPLTYSTFETLFRDLRKRSGVRQVTAHSYRHTFAQGLLDTTDNLALVQAFLAHSSPETTATTYVHVPIERMVRAVHDLEQRPTVARDDHDSPAYAFAYDIKSLTELELLFKDAGHE